MGCNCGLCDCGCILTSIDLLQVAPNEIVLVKTSRVLHPEGVHLLESELSRLLPKGTQCIVVMPDLEVTVVPTEAGLLENLLTLRQGINMKGTDSASRS